MVQRCGNVIVDWGFLLSFWQGRVSGASASAVTTATSYYFTSSTFTTAACFYPPTAGTTPSSWMVLGSRSS